MRQKVLAETIGPLDMEIEAWNTAFFLSWLPYPIFVAMAVCQFYFFNLYNRKYHPLAEILDGKIISTQYIEKTNSVFPGETTEISGLIGSSGKFQQCREEQIDSTPLLDPKTDTGKAKSTNGDGKIVLTF